MKLQMKVTVKGKGPVNLTKNDYKGSGGEGTVYCKNGVGYKIYHNPNKIVPPAKIQELRQIALPNVLAPMDILLGTGGTPIGFTMPYVDNVEFLCKLFVRSYRDKNGLSPQDMMNLVKAMQETLMKIHKQGFLVVDYNEMNFLVSLDFKIPYHIDVDSYKTPSFPPTALMESVRDRFSPKSKFTELTDWFSWAVVTFQLYMGVHPFKGRHPQYKPKEWMRMMDDNVSVFYPNVRLPANTQDWAVIPKRHLEWYKKVFLNKERSIPPFADQIGPIAVPKPVLISGTDKFEVAFIEDYPTPIRDVRLINGIRYVIVDGEVYANKKKIFDFNRKARIELCEVHGGSPVVAFQMPGNDVCFVHTALSGAKGQGETIGRIAADAMTAHKGRIYTLNNGTLTENTCTQFAPGKIVHHAQAVCNVFEPAYKMFRSVVTQDIMGQCWLAVPCRPGGCPNIHVPELNGYRIIDAEYVSGYKSGFCVVIAEKNGIYDRFVLHLNLVTGAAPSVRIDQDVELDTVSIIALPNKLCIMVVNDLRVEAFFDNTKVKVIEDPPLDSGMKLFEENGKVLFASKNKLHSVRLK